VLTGHGGALTGTKTSFEKSTVSVSVVNSVAWFSTTAGPHADTLQTLLVNSSVVVPLTGKGPGWLDSQVNPAGQVSKSVTVAVASIVLVVVGSGGLNGAMTVTPNGVPSCPMKLVMVMVAWFRNDPAGGRPNVKVIGIHLVSPGASCSGVIVLDSKVEKPKPKLT
jgi:hypothetical protein